MTQFWKTTNSASLAFMVAGAAFFALGTLYGMLSAIHLVAPEFFNNIPALVFGRTRPSHVNTMVFGFVSMMLFGAVLHIVPALLRTRLWSETLGWISFALWTITVLSGEITFPMGLTQGREYSEYLWTFDVTLMISLSLSLVNILMTVATRRENTLYVSVWYVMLTVIAMAAIYPIGNVMWRPPTGALPGLLDSIYLWYYGHNLVGVLLTPLAVAAIYYVFPRVTQTPLYSHTLSLVGFWTLIALYTHIGGHHILQSPIPNWLKTVSVVDSMAMAIPVAIVLGNVWLTARGKFGMLWHDIPARWVLVGTLWYFVTCVQGPLQSLPSVQKITHFNNWTVGHAHIAVLGFSGFVAIGAMYHVLPAVCGRHLYSKRLASLQFGLVLTGLAGFFVALTTAGLIQGENWYHGQTVYNVLPMLPPFMVVRAASGMFLLVGSFVGLYNVIMTLRCGQRVVSSPLDEVTT